MSRATIRAVFSAARVVRAAIYLSVSYVLLLPILTTPIIADDFLNPFSQAADGGGGLLNAVRYGWRASTEGSSFRPVGNVVGGVYNWLWPTLSATFNINLATLYGITKYFVFVGCAMSVAGYWWTASRVHGCSTRYWDALVLTSIALFGTLQIHAVWSNDPVASYPLAGYAPTALGFGVLAVSLVASWRQVWVWYVGGACIGMFAVGYYEINIGAVLGAAVILSVAVWRGRSDRRQTRRAAAGSFLIVAAPAALVLYGRSVTAANSVSYSGTEVSASKAAPTLVRGIVGSFPGAAWRLSGRALGGEVNLVAVSFAVIFVLVLAARWWSRGASAHALRRKGRGNRMGLLAASAAVVVYATFAVALQAATSKVQNEMRGIGYVYTFYAVTSCALALGIAALVRALIHNERLRPQRFFVMAFGIAFVFVQFTINWNISASMNEVQVRNRRLTASFDSDAPMAQRCDALVQWAQGEWPLYYEQGMTDGLQVAYQYYFGEPFCAGYTPSG